ncbi:MAG TPA: hypothetical protein VM223_06465 [Planctomycetota bacterium]|nr:hypothetical protein [Planctomycetota bacterium]
MAEKNKHRRKTGKGIISKVADKVRHRTQPDADEAEADAVHAPASSKPPALAGGTAAFIDNPRPRRFWPKDKPMPAAFRKVRREFLPCKRCRRILLDDGGQAVIVTSSGDKLVALRCRSCNHTFQLPVEEV